MRVSPWVWVLGAVAVASAIGGGLTMLKWHTPPFVSDALHKRTKKPRGIVIHWSVTSTADHTLNVLQKRGLATNYEVDHAGTIREYADPKVWYADASGAGANSETIAIDLTHLPGQSWQPAQLAATRQLVHHLAQTFGLPVVVAPDGVRNDWHWWRNKGFTVFRHRNLRPTQCPGDFPLEAMV